MKPIILATTLAIPFIISASLEAKPVPTKPVEVLEQLQPIGQTYEPVAPIITQKPIKPTASTEPEMTPERCQQERNVDNIDFAMACKNAGVWWSDGKN